MTKKEVMKQALPLTSTSNATFYKAAQAIGLACCLIFLASYHFTSTEEARIYFLGAY